LNKANKALSVLTFVIFACLLASCGTIDNKDTLPVPDAPSSSPEAQDAVEPSLRPLPSPPAATEPPASAQPKPSAVEPVETHLHEPSVNVSKVDKVKPSPEPEPAREQPFRSEQPSLGGVALGASDLSVKELHGHPEATYTLPGDDSAVDIWEYAGFSVGFDTNGNAVYIEVSSSDVPTEIQGLRTGMAGSDAARLLDIADRPESRVLTLEVSQGWLKLDLDPTTREVLSIKLINSQI